MFVGHYAVSLAVKSKEREIPLWQLFLAVQFVDILFFTFSFFGIERFNIVPHYTPSTNFELVYMPYTHGLAATLVWGLLTYAVFRLPALGGSKRVALWMAVAVMSHWVLDLIVHTADLPLLGDNSPKIGLGLWNYPIATFLLEALLLAIGAWLLLKDNASKKLKRRIIGFVVALVVINAANLFGPPGGGTETGLAVTALVLYFGLAGFAYWAADR
ncbi:MAG: hypothetical protein WBW88_11780 [Rhodothermales bacterium]